MLNDLERAQMEFAKAIIRRGWDDHMWNFENMDERDENWLNAWAGEPQRVSPEWGYPEGPAAVKPGNASDNVPTSFGRNTFEDSSVMGAGGFEPPFNDSPGPERPDSLREGGGA